MPSPTINNIDVDDTFPTVAVQYTCVMSFYAFYGKQATANTCTTLSVINDYEFTFS